MVNTKEYRVHMFAVALLLELEATGERFFRNHLWVGTALSANTACRQAEEDAKKSPEYSGWQVTNIKHLKIT